VGSLLCLQEYSGSLLSAHQAHRNDGVPLPRGTALSWSYDDCGSMWSARPPPAQSCAAGLPLWWRTPGAGPFRKGEGGTSQRAGRVRARLPGAVRDVFGEWSGDLPLVIAPGWERAGRGHSPPARRGTDAIRRGNSRVSRGRPVASRASSKTSSLSIAVTSSWFRGCRSPVDGSPQPGGSGPSEAGVPGVARLSSLSQTYRR
jgi:hypothetical protein